MESFVSDIGPHRELLRNVKYQVIHDLNTRLPSLYVKREDLDSKNLKSWDQVIREMLIYFQLNNTSKSGFCQIPSKRNDTDFSIFHS